MKEKVKKFFKEHKVGIAIALVFTTIVGVIIKITRKEVDETETTFYEDMETVENISDDTQTEEAYCLFKMDDMRVTDIDEYAWGKSVIVNNLSIDQLGELGNQLQNHFDNTYADTEVSLVVDIIVPPEK